MRRAWRPSLTFDDGSGKFMITTSAEITRATGEPQAQLDPSHIMQVGTGFWASKTLLSAVELEVFTEVGGDAITGEELGRRLGLHRRGVDDFFDALVALGFLGRDGDGAEARYRNTAETTPAGFPGWVPVARRRQARRACDPEGR